MNMWLFQISIFPSKDKIVYFCVGTGLRRHASPDSKMALARMDRMENAKLRG